MDKGPPRPRVYWTPLNIEGFEPVELREDQIIHIPTMGVKTRIVCVPTPGPNGLHYAPDWHGLPTHE